MSTALALSLAAALWAGCLLPGPPWLTGVALVILLAARCLADAAGRSTRASSVPQDAAVEGASVPGARVRDAAAQDASARERGNRSAHGQHTPGTRPTRDRPGRASAGRGIGSLWPTAMIVVAVCVLGAGLSGGRALLRDRSPLVDMAARGAVAEVSARVVTEPRPTAFGAWTVVRVSRVDTMTLGARAVLYLDDRTGVALGETLTGRMRLTAPPDGGFGGYLLTLGVAAALRPVGQPTGGPAPSWLAQTTVVRERARAAFAEALPPSRAALLGGLVLGARDDIDTDTLRDAGLIHLVVVSGRHVAVLLVGVLTVAALIGLGHRGRHRTALTVLWWFVVLTRWQPSVLRAAVMATLVLIAALVGRGRQPLHSLAVAVLLLLLADPMLARQAGFAMSVLATGGVLAALRTAPTGRARAPLRTAARATVFAQVATAPVALTMTDALSLGTVPANLIGSVAATVAQSLGLCAAVLAAVRLPGAVTVARLAGLPLGVLEWAARTFGGWPSVTAGHLVLLVAAAGVVALLLRRPDVAVTARRRRALVVAVAVGWLAIVLQPWPAPSRGPTHLRLVAFDVGQGDAVLIESPDDDGVARMLVDGGPVAGDVAALLRRRRVRRLHAVVATHGDHDHTGGLTRVLRDLRVGALLVPAGDAWMRDGSPSARDAVGEARRRDVPVVELHAGQRFAVGDTSVEVLAPPAAGGPATDRNARSVVLRVGGEHGRVLLTGDAEASAQARLLATPGRLRADVLKVPHHGGATNAPGFLDAVRADVAVVSVGSDNPYGHPHPDTVRDIAPVPLWRTDRHGTITITLTPEGPVVDQD